MSQATQNFVDKCKQLFEEADVDHNGLSIQELYSIVHKVSGNKLSDAEIAVSKTNLTDARSDRHTRS